MMLENMSKIVLLRFVLLLMSLGSINSRGCEGYYPCDTDTDCWNGPGFRCSNSTDWSGKIGEGVCVCGGYANGYLDAPDGIPRKYFCGIDEFQHNGVQLCLIRPGYPCYPLESVYENYFIGEGVDLPDNYLERQDFNFYRDIFCGRGLCGQEPKDDGLYYCRELGNNFI